MPRIHRPLFLAAAAGLLACSGSALAQRAHIAPADRNAALAYSTLFYAELPKELTDAVDAADLNEVGLETDAAKQPESYKLAAAKVRDRQGAVRRFLAATSLKKCDFEIAYESGFNALLSHLGFMRKTGRLLRLDARRMLLEGNPDAAAERVAGIYRLAGHLKSDDTLISSLVSIAIAGLGNAESEVLIKSGKLTAAGREEIMKAIGSLGRTDPFGVKEAVHGERTITVQWIREKFPAPGSGPAFVKAITKEWGLAQGSREELNQIEAMDDAAFAKSLDRLDEYHNIVQTQWDLPDSTSRLEALANRIGQSDFGPLTKFLAPSFSKARAGQFKAEAELDATIQHLKKYTAPAANQK
jgi:hypothetical protein